MLVCSVQIISRLDRQSNFQMFTLYFGRHVGTWLCKFLRNISTNISGLGKRTDVKLGQVSCLFISNKIIISCMTGRKTCALWVLPVVPYKALENFSKALYGTTERYLQCRRFPSCHVYPVNGFRFIFLLRDSENDLLMLQSWYQKLPNHLWTRWYYFRDTIGYHSNTMTS